MLEYLVEHQNLSFSSCDWVSNVQSVQFMNIFPVKMKGNTQGSPFDGPDTVTHTSLAGFSVLKDIYKPHTSLLWKVYINTLTLILLPGAFSVFVNFFYFFRVEIINQKFWENLTFIFSIWRLIFCKKKNFFKFFSKVPKKAPGNRITNFLNMNQCIIKYQNCQKRLQVNWLIIKVPKKAPGNRITNFLRVTRLGLKDCKNGFRHQKQDFTHLRLFSFPWIHYPDIDNSYTTFPSKIHFWKSAFPHKIWYRSWQ